MQTKTRKTIEAKGAFAPHILGPEFFTASAEKVARALIGQTLVRVTDASLPPEGFMITETEAYIGPHDLACHAARGRTKRTDVLFGPPGHLYIYFVYGMHWMLNIVTREEGYPSGVLIRGLEGINGPGRVARHLGLDGVMSGRPASPETGLWIEQSRPFLKGRAILTTPRIGIDYAGPRWRDRKLRFVLSRSPRTKASPRIP